MAHIETTKAALLDPATDSTTPATKRPTLKPSAKGRPLAWINGFALGVKHLISVQEINWVALEFVCFAMREIDQREIYGNMTLDNPLALCGMIMQAVRRKDENEKELGCGWIGFCDGRPAGWIAFFENWPGNWQITMGGTDEFRFVMFEMMRKFYTGCHFAVERGCHRIECRSMADHPEAGRMCHIFGATMEGRLHAYGKDGSDYQQWSWTGEALRTAAEKGRVSGPTEKPGATPGASPTEAINSEINDGW